MPHARESTEASGASPDGEGEALHPAAAAAAAAHVGNGAHPARPGGDRCRAAPTGQTVQARSGQGSPDRLGARPGLELPLGGSCWASFGSPRARPRAWVAGSAPGPIRALLRGIMVSGPGWLLWRDRSPAAGGSQGQAGACWGGGRAQATPSHGGLSRPLPLGVYHHVARRWQFFGCFVPSGFCPDTTGPGSRSLRQALSSGRVG